MRLSKQVKEAIFNAALKKAGIPEKKSAIRARYAAWAEAVRVRYVTPEQIKLIEAAIQATSAVDPALVDYSFHPRKMQAIESANVAGQRRTVWFCGAVYGDQRDKSQPRKIAPYTNQVTLAADDPMVNQLHSIDHDSEALQQEIQQLNCSLWAVLNSVTTDKRLVEIWPEAVAFIPAAEKANTPQLPALPITELNKLIGLP